MSFINDSTKARIAFVKQVKEQKLDPASLKYSAEYCDEEQACYVYATDENDDVRVVRSFSLNPLAWTSKLQHQIEKMFRGSALIAIRGRC